MLKAYIRKFMTIMSKSKAVAMRHAISWHELFMIIFKNAFLHIANIGITEVEVIKTSASHNKVKTNA